MAIVKRIVKGTPLTYQELDNNFTELDTRTSAVEGTGAASGSVYISDGAGSGDFEKVQGFGQYQDDRRTVGSPALTLSNGVRTLLPCNGGFLTVERLSSDASESYWNISTNKHIPVNAFDIFDIRIGLVCENYSGQSPYITLDIDIGSPIGIVYTRDISLKKAGAAAFASAAFPVFTGATYITNGAELYITYTGSGTCVIHSVDILLIRSMKSY